MAAVSGIIPIIGKQYSDSAAIIPIREKQYSDSIAIIPIMGYTVA